MSRNVNTTRATGRGSSMYKFAGLASLVLLFSRAMFGQEPPKAELGLGYSYMRLHVASGAPGVNMHGVQADLTGNANRWLGATAQFNEYYHCVTGCFLDTSIARRRAFTFVVGPRMAIRPSSRYTLWIHALFGLANVRYSDDFGTKTSATGSAMAFGGGVEVPAGPVAFRVIQVDYFRNTAQQQAFNNVRIAVTVAIPLGKRAR
jgi:hypothetical protein